MLGDSPCGQYSMESLCCGSGPLNEHKQNEYLLGLPNHKCSTTFHHRRAEWKCALLKYLGSVLLSNGQTLDEMTTRANSGHIAVLQFRRVLWAGSEISLQIKICVFRASDHPMLTYGFETWPLWAEDISRSEVFDHWCMRQILRINW